MKTYEDYKTQLDEATTEEEKLLIMKDWIAEQELEVKKNNYKKIVGGIRDKEYEALKVKHKSYFDARKDMESIFKNVEKNIDDGFFDLVDEFINKEE